jgi:hypothetical protein
LTVFLTDKVQKDLKFHSAVGVLQRDPRKLKITTWSLPFAAKTLTEIASKQSDPDMPLMACRASPAPPQFRPGTKPLGRRGDFDAGEARLEDLTKR